MWNHQTSEHQCWTSEHQRTSVQGELLIPRLYAPAPESVGSNSPPWPGGAIFQIFSEAGLLAWSLNPSASHQFERQRTRSYFWTSANISSRTSVSTSEHQRFRTSIDIRPTFRTSLNINAREHQSIFVQLFERHRSSVFPSELPNLGDHQSSLARPVERQSQSGEVGLWWKRDLFSSFN